MNPVSLHYISMFTIRTEKRGRLVIKFSRFESLFKKMIMLTEGTGLEHLTPFEYLVDMTGTKIMVGTQVSCPTVLGKNTMHTHPRAYVGVVFSPPSCADLGVNKDLSGMVLDRYCGVLWIYTVDSKLYGEREEIEYAKLSSMMWEPQVNIKKYVEGANKLAGVRIDCFPISDEGVVGKQY